LRLFSVAVGKRQQVGNGTDSGAPLAQGLRMSKDRVTYSLILRVIGARRGRAARGRPEEAYRRP